MLSEKLKGRNCPSKYIKRKKNPEKRATEYRVGWPFNSALGSKNASSWSSPKGFKNCFLNDPINYRQTMPDDRFTLVKMNITSQEGGIMITNDTSTKWVLGCALKLVPKRDV